MLVRGFDRLQYSAVAQQVPAWGWAAAIASILAYKSNAVEQADLVSRSFGRPLDERAFEGKYRSSSGTEFVLSLHRTPLPRVDQILEWIALDQPFLVVQSGRAYLFLRLHFRVGPTGEKEAIRVDLGDVMPGGPRVVEMETDRLFDAYVVTVHVTNDAR